MLKLKKYIKSFQNNKIFHLLRIVYGIVYIFLSLFVFSLSEMKELNKYLFLFLGKAKPKCVQ